MALTKEQLKALSDKTFFDNDQGEIEPAEHRAFNNALIDNMTLEPTTGYVARDEFESIISKYLSLILDMEYIDSYFQNVELGDLFTIRVYYNGAFLPELKALDGVYSLSNTYGDWMWNNAISTNLGATVLDSSTSGIKIKEIRNNGNKCCLDIDFSINNFAVTQVNVKLRSLVLNGFEQTKSIPFKVI
jgi:hypothetical protein